MATIIQHLQLSEQYNQEIKLEYSERWVLEAIKRSCKDYTEILEFFDNDPTISTPKKNYLRQMMKTLIDLGLVKRNDHPKDGRSYTYSSLGDY